MEHVSRSCRRHVDGFVEATMRAFGLESALSDVSSLKRKILKGHQMKIPTIKNRNLKKSSRMSNLYNRKQDRRLDLLINHWISSTACQMRQHNKICARLGMFERIIWYV